MNNNNNNNRKRTISSADIITTKNSGNPATSSSAVVESEVKLTNSKRMKAIAGEIEIESKKKFENLGERSENVENSEIRTPVVVEKAPVKKKTRVVKKIVKKTVIKKVPKRVVVARSNSNESAVIEIEKPNVVFDEDELKDVVIVNEKEVDSVRNNDSCRNESEGSGVVTALLTSDQNWIEVQDVEHCRVEMQENDQNGIELQNSDQNGIELQNVDRNRVEMLDNDQNRIELQNSDHNRVEMQGNDGSGIELQDSDQNQIELQNVDNNRVEMQDNDQNCVELQDMEHDISTMDVEEHEGEEEVKDLVVNNENNETDGLKLQEDLSESRVMNGKMVTDGLRVKHRTKIFIHGLDEKIKEEDIRKVFEEIGEVVEVKLITNFNTGKSRGFGFIRYASADLANMALTKFHNVEICGRPCITAAIEGTDAILLNNIDKNWNNEYVVTLLQKIGVKKIDEVWVVPDSENTELNLGYAFIEFETKRDAQIAFNKLQNKYVFGKDSKIKAAWAEPSVKEEMNNGVKSVYAEHIPSSWDENEVKDHFIIFGAIESIALAKNLRSTHRKDFAFINFKTCEAARSCVEALSSKKSTNKNGAEGQLKVSLAKSIPKGKPVNTTLQSTVTEVSKVYKKVNQSIPSQSRYQKASQLRPFQENPPVLGVYKPQLPTNMKFPSIGRHEDCKKDVGSSTTDELVRLLREQASWKHGGPSSSAGVSIGHHQVPSGSGKQSFTELGSNSLYHDRQPYPQTHFQISNPAPPRPLASSFPHYDQQRAPHTSGPFNVAKLNPRHFQIRDQATYPGSSSIYRQRQ